MKLTENKVKAEVTINREVIKGFIDEKNCSACQIAIVYYEYYDALFCPNCNEWLEPNCEDKDCPHHCDLRPPAPLSTKKAIA